MKCTHAYTLFLTTKTQSVFILRAQLLVLASTHEGTAYGYCGTQKSEDYSMSLTHYFNAIPDIHYEGPDSDNPFAYRYYDPGHEILGKPMSEWMRCAVCYWHTLTHMGSDNFGAPTREWPWDKDTHDVIDRAIVRTNVLFDLVAKLGLEYYTFHDRDVAPEVESLRQTNANLHRVADHLAKIQEATNVRLLWGTSALFKHPRYAQGASTSPDPKIFAAAANQVKEMLDVTQQLGGGAFTMWAGRDGYQTLLNTDMEREQAQLVRWLEMVRDYARSIGFQGPLFLEPKPREPLKQQYDYDAAAVTALLRTHHLDRDYKLNIEANHAQLAGHEFAYELEYARINGMLGSVDANRGEPLLGWDVDEFPIDPQRTTMAWLAILKQGGLAPGGLNFDAKLRRESTAPEDLFHAHMAGIDAWARGLRIAARVTEDGEFERHRHDRYRGWDGELGRTILNGEADLADLQAHILAQENANPPPSAQQEYWQNRFRRYF